MEKTNTALLCSTDRSKHQWVNSTSDAPVTVDDKPLEVEVSYLGRLTSIDKAASKDISGWLGKACIAFARLLPIGKSQQYHLKTKLRLYNSNVKYLFCCMVLNAVE